jgi:hypothetical protein
MPDGNIKMKFSKLLLFWGMLILTTLACGLGNDLSTPTSVAPPVATWTLPPSVIPRQPRTPTSLPLLLPPTPTATATFPAWVANFSDPILAALAGQRPDFQDEFLNFDRGWFYFIPDSSKGPYYAHIQDKSLLLELPAENEKRDYWVYNPRLLRRNFVLSFELQFLESQPQDIVRIQFDQTPQQGVAFDLSKNQNWNLYWGPFSDWRSRTGTYVNFPPVPIMVLVIVKGEECAIYLDDVPLAYLADCRDKPVVRSSPWAMAFHLLAEPGHVASAAIDNLKLWDLDKVPTLP